MVYHRKNKKTLPRMIILCIILMSIILPISVSASDFIHIMGETQIDKKTIVQYYKENSPISYPEEYLNQGVGLEGFVDLVIRESKAEGIRWDIAFAQILVETDWFKFSDEVNIARNNFGRLKDQEGNYLSFRTLEEGIRANIQLLKGYASAEPLNKEKIIPTYDLINPKGIVVNVEDLGNGNWSEDSEYGEKIKIHLQKIINMQTMEQMETKLEVELEGINQTVNVDSKNQIAQNIYTSTNNEILTTTSVSQPVEVKTLTIDGTGYVGSSHRIRSYGTSLNGALYQFWIKDLSTNKWTMIQDYSKSSVAWIPAIPGKYLYGVHIKDEKSQEKLDAHLYKEIIIEGVPTEVRTLTIDGSGYTGSNHRIRSYGTSNNGVLYQFWVKDLSENKWTMIQDYSKSSAIWIPTKPGKYLYGVHIKDEKSNEKLDKYLYKEIEIKGVSAEVKTLTIDGSGCVGDSHRIRSYGTSNNGVLYQFWVKDLSANKWTMIQDYSKSSATWIPTKQGKYLYGVHIKDEKSSKMLDSYLYKEMTIKGSLHKKTIMLDPGHEGKYPLDPGAVGNRLYEYQLNNSLTKMIANKLESQGYNVIYTRNPNIEGPAPLKERDEKVNSLMPDLLISIHHDSSVNRSASGYSIFWSSYRYRIDKSGIVVTDNGVEYPFVDQIKRMVNGSEETYIVYNKNGKNVEKNINDSDGAIMVRDRTLSTVAKESQRFANILHSKLQTLDYIDPRPNPVNNNNIYIIRETNVPTVLFEGGFISNSTEAQKINNTTNQNKFANKVVEAVNAYFK
ncbi:N-acetylmuramoyl-L-alanine amidase [Alkalibaculum bacchi]|uniref:N-acetylmuramoyl-L-alanine amidase n=2 Tax=Alkalibaculum bacchi TaxID=645887 RepID=A0A366IDR0_9FIRM|nr:N-acetylmuramoyl-L-alanine amidase [Alkalibaculum bacchi]RBP69078.1 N-acetylmuramoyl-L-alanine amidase [Alkalibaculum bacchi]